MDILVSTSVENQAIACCWPRSAAGCRDQPGPPSRSSATAHRVPAADPASGPREPGLGFSPHQGRAAQAGLSGLGDLDRSYPAPPPSGAGAAAGGIELAAIPAGSGRCCAGLRLLQRRQRLVEAAVRAALHQADLSSGLPGRLHRAADRGLGPKQARNLSWELGQANLRPRSYRLRTLPDNPNKSALLHVSYVEGATDQARPSVSGARLARREEA